MTKRHSSTFSSNAAHALEERSDPTECTRTSEGPIWRAGAYVPRAAVVAVALILVLEVALRFCVKIPQDAGQFWADRAEARVLLYREVLKKGAPDVVVVGDSLGQCGVDPHAFQGATENASLSAYNLSNPGVYLSTAKEMVIEPEILQAARVPEYLVLAFNMLYSLRQGTTTRAGQGVLDSLLARKRRNDVGPLERLFLVENRSVLLRYLRRRTFRADALSLEDQGYWPNRTEDRPQGPLAERSWGPALRDAEARLADVFTGTKRRSIEPIVLLTPLPKAFVASYTDWEYAMAHLVELCTKHSVRLVDATALFDETPVRAMREYFSDWRHLNAVGAQRFSEALGRRWGDVLRQPAGKPYVLTLR